MRKFFTNTSRIFPLLVAAAPLLAQGVSSQLSGKVTGKGQGPIEGANITVRNNETGMVRVIRTDARGRFVLSNLPVGPYVVTATHGSFQTASSIKVNLNLGDAAPLNIVMAPATGATVEVVATMGKVDAERSTSAAFVSSDDLLNMPNFNRSFTNLATLTPQVTVDPTRGALAIAGQRGVSSSMNVDGADNNEPFFGGSMSASTPFQMSMEAIKEFQVITAGASAEYGRMGGGYVNAITKNGTNQLTGSLFYYTRPQSLVAKQPNLNGIAGSNNVGDFKQNQFGFSVGGPILKDKLFYFVAYDGQRMTSPNNFTWGGNTPVTLDPKIPADAVLLSKAGNYDVDNNADTAFVRLDWNVSSDHTLQAHINRSSYTTSAYTGISSPWENTLSDKYKTLTLGAQWNWTINANFLNEFRLNVGKDEMPRATRSSIPEVSISNVGYYGANPYPREYETKRTQFTETLSYITPTLQLKGGIDYNKIHISEIFSSQYQGVYYFNDTSVKGVVTKTALQNFEAGLWNSYQQRFSLIPGVDGWNAGNFDANEEQLALFVQGDLRVSDSFKVGLGLRYDRQTHPDFPITSFDNPLAATMPLNRTMPTDGQFSPRVSFTWSPAFDHGKSVVRGSAGRYVSSTPAVYEYQLYTVNGARMASVTFNASDAAKNGIPFGTVGAAGVVAGGFNPASPYRFDSMPSGTSAPKSDIYSFDRNFKNPHTDQVTLGIDRAFGQALMVGISGIYARGHNLQRATDINLPTPVANTSGRMMFTASRPNPNFNMMMNYVSDVDSIYHAYTLNLKYQEEGNPFFAQIYYTYAIDKDSDSNERNFAAYSEMNTQRLGDDWSYSDKDRRNVATAVLSYLDKKWTGIQAGLSYRYQSGTPYSLTFSGDVNKDGIKGNDRYYINGQDSGRNAYRGASNSYVDLKLSRDFQVAKSAKFAVSAEIFNLLNRHDTYIQQYLTGSADPGSIATRNAVVGSARQVQLGARLTF